VFDGLLLPSLRTTAAARRELDGLDPINQGRVFWPMNGGNPGVAQEISPRRINATPTGTSPTIASTTMGPAFSLAMTGTNTLSAPNTYRGSTHFTYSIWLRLPSAPGAMSPSGVMGRFLEATIGDRSFLRWEGPSLGWYYDDIGSGSSFFLVQTGASYVSWGANEWHMLTLSIWPGGAQFYWDGKPMTTSGGGTPGVRPGSPFNIGRAFTGHMLAASYWPAVLRPNTVARLYSDPWAGTIDPAARLFHAMRGAGGAVPFTAEPGPAALVWAGQQASVSAGVVASPGAGSLAWSGQAASVAAAVSASPGPAALVWAGQAAAIAAGVVVTPGAAAITWAGHQAAITAGVVASPGPAALAWAGQQASVAISGSVTAAPGAAALAWQGQAAAVSAGVVASPGPAALVWQGQAANTGPPAVAAVAPPERTIIWPYQARAVEWPVTDRIITWRQ